jgi:flagellar biosynthesis protein
MKKGMKKGDRREAAVALAYRPGQLAPRIVAKGNGLVAEAIIRQAQAHGIYVHESPALVSLLMQVDLDQHIPPQLYRAVAELLAWLYQMEARPENSTAQLELARDKHNGSTSNQDR